MNGFIEVSDGLFYEEATGLPWSTRVKRSGATDGKLKPLTSKSRGYYDVDINGKSKLWHRVLWEHFNGSIPEGMSIDHINNNPLDNRISNLQLLSHKSNSRYRLKQKNNTSGFAGINYHKKSNKWQARISIDGKSKYLGLFDDKELAHQAYLQAKIKYHGKESIRAL